MSRFDAVLIDLGHTLVDFDVEDGALLKSYAEVDAFLNHLGVVQGTVEPDLIFRVSRHAIDAIVASYERGEIEELDMLTLFDEALRHHGFQLEPSIVQELLWREHSAYASHLFVRDETIATLRALRRRGFALGIVSNATIPGPLMREDLSLIGLDTLVDAVTFSSEVGVRKPDRRIFEVVLDTLKLDPARCLFVGDRLKEDVGGSRALGMRPILTHEFRKEQTDQPVDTIARFCELLAIVDR